LADIDSLRSGAHETTGLVLGALPFVALFGLVLALNVGMAGD
jgi:hypothetical protein